jgi:diguanylate cyclase (GGDEF)-like protein
MSYRSYEWKIIYVLILVFVLIQTGVFLALNKQVKSIALETLELELATGAQVLDRLLALRHRQLEQSARVLAADIEVRDALMRNNLAAAKTLLMSHEGRINTALMLVTDMSDSLLISIPGYAEDINPENVVLNSAEYAQAARERKPLVALINNGSEMIYQIITVPVSSTLPVAWLTIGFTLADSLAQSLDSVANTQYSFLSRLPGQPWREHVSTFSQPDIGQLLPQFSLDADDAQILQGVSEEYLVMPFTLSRFENLELVAMVGKSLDQATRPFLRLRANLLFWALFGALVSALAIYTVTRRMVGPLNTMAHVDLLTGLANRRVFERAVNKLSSSAGTVSSKALPFGVMLMDLEGFVQINDELGHTVGDEVLKITAERLRDTLRKSDVIARYGGDEFAVLMPNVDRQSCCKVAEMILESLERKITVDGADLEVGISIGIAISPQDGSDRATLLKKADLAMHSARNAGRGFALYSGKE